MKKIIFLIAILAASAVIVTSFFSPWAKLHTSVTGVSKELTKSAKSALEKAPPAGKLIDQLDKITTAIGKIGDVEVKMTVRGNNIPTLVNNQTSKVALALVQVLFKSKGIEGLDKKSYLVYLIPLFGIICLILAIIGLKSKIYIAIMALISGVIAIGGLYNLNTMDVANPIIKISIGKGLWDTMYAFAFIFLIGIVWLLLPNKRA